MQLFQRRVFYLLKNMFIGLKRIIDGMQMKYLK